MAQTLPIERYKPHNMNLPIRELKGMSAELEARLKQHGIGDSDQLLSATRTSAACRDLAKAMGVEASVVLELVADLSAQAIETLLAEQEQVRQALVTERHRMETALQESEERQRRLIEGSPDGVALTDLNGRILMCSRQDAILHGYDSIGEMIGKDAFDLVAPEDRARAMDRAREMFESGIGGAREYCLLKKDGTRFPAEVNTSVIMNADGDPCLILGIGRDITDRKRAEQTLRRHAEEKAALYETSLEINSQLDISTLLQAIVQRAAGLVGTQMGGLYLMRSDNHTLELVVSHNLPCDYSGVTLRLGEGIAGRVAQTGKPMAIDDYLHWEGRAAAYASAAFRRVLGVPLQVRNKVIGVITINDDTRTDPFDEDEIRLVSMFADQATIAIENARLYQAEHEQRELAETLREVGAILASTLDLHTILERVLQQVGRVLPNDAAGILLVEEGHAHVVRWHGSERFSSQDWSQRAFPIADTQYLKQMQVTGTLVVVPDTAADPSWIGAPGADWVRSFVAVPIRARGAVIGFLNVASATPGLFTSAHAERLLMFADQAAIAIENARLYQAEQEQRELAETLREVGATLVSTLDTHVVVDRILEQVSRVTPNDVANIMLIEGDRAHVAGWRSYERFGTPNLASVTFSVAGTRNLQRMVETGEPAVIQDVQADPHWIHVPGTERLRSYAGVPIRVRGETIGFLGVHSIIPGHFERTDAEKLRAFADQAAIAWENARLFEDTRRTAEHLQALSHRMVEAQEAERRLIARELHDEIGQTLTAVKINLQALQRSSDALRHSAILEENVTVVERALQQVRNLSLDLRPSLLDDLGLVPALRWYVNRQAERAGFTAVFTADSLQAHLSPDLEIACFRVAQEALTNVVRYARAQHVVVELLQRDTELELTIRDDGVGFDVESALERARHGASLGLLGMEERVSLVGGQMEIESVAMCGTEIRARFPLASPSSRADGPPVG